MKKIYMYILLVFLATFSATVHAEQGTEKSLDAIVEVRISVPENARTAERFGTNRVAGGVVIEKAGIKAGDIILAVNVSIDRSITFCYLYSLFDQPFFRSQKRLTIRDSTLQSIVPTRHVI